MKQSLQKLLVTHKFKSNQQMHMNFQQSTFATPTHDSASCHPQGAHQRITNIHGIQTHTHTHTHTHTRHHNGSTHAGHNVKMN
jgi:hypothetical protein